MPYVLNHYRTEDTYTQEGTLDCQQSVGVHLRIAWAGVYVQIAPETDTPGLRWEPETHYHRGSHFLQRNARAVRVRSAVPLIPALVTLEAVKIHE